MEIMILWGCIAALVLALMVAFYLIQQLKRAGVETNSLFLQQLSEFERDAKVIKLELEEIRQSSVGIGKNVKTLGQYFSQLEQKFNEVELFEPESKLYSRAAKLAEKGASVEEIMTECEIPRAEAELVLSLRNKMSR